MTQFGSSFTFFTAALLASSLVVGGCCKKKATVTGSSDECPAKFNMLPGANTASEVSCTCSASSIHGPVWGTDIYTTDSSICAAARHAGVIPASGGKVTMKKVAGCKSYEGTARNGITSHAWPSYGSSFYFVQPGKPAPSCFVKKTSSSPKDKCPRRFNAATLPADKTLRCTCTPDLMTGSVWGTETYTTDSSVCLAARHAGVIGPNGGPIVAKLTSGCKRYKGTKANGVRTSSWGKYKTSFFFPSKSQGHCQ